MWQTIKQRLKNNGPIHILLNEDEYVYLKKYFKKIWLETNYKYWSEDERLIALGYLRGYTLYREIPENPKQFWVPFLAELGLDYSQPGQRRFDELWSAFSMHPQTREYLVIHNGRRMFVQSINKIWGVKGLRAVALGELLDEYLKKRESDEKPNMRAMLIAKPEYQHLARHSETYKRIFEGVYRLLSALKDEPDLAWGYLRGEITEKEFISELQSMGLFFSKPHPLKYLRNKSEKLLRKLLLTHVKLVDHKIKPQVQKKKLNDINQHKSVKVRFGLTRLPGLESLKIIPDIKRRTVLLENRWVTGEARLASGARDRFRWKPKLDESGEPVWVRPEGEGVSLGFGDDEVRVEFELLPKNVFHLELNGYRDILEWTERSRFSAKKTRGLQAGYLQFRLVSQEDASKNLDDLAPNSNDTLLIDYVYQGDAFEVERVPLRFTPRLVSWEAFRNPHGVEVHVKAELPKDGVILLQVRTSKGLQQKELGFSESGEYSASFQVDHLLSAEVEVELRPDGATDAKTLPPEIDWKQAFRAGVGIGSFSPGKD